MALPIYIGAIGCFFGKSSTCLIANWRSAWHSFNRVSEGWIIRNASGCAPASHTVRSAERYIP